MIIMPRNIHVRFRCAVRTQHILNIDTFHSCFEWASWCVCFCCVFGSVAACVYIFTVRACVGIASASISSTSIFACSTYSIRQPQPPQPYMHMCNIYSCLYRISHTRTRSLMHIPCACVLSANTYRPSILSVKYTRTHFSLCVLRKSPNTHAHQHQCT